MRQTDDGRTLLRNSERVSYLRCRQKWQWGWLDGWTPKTAAPALRFGTLVHEALAAYYKPGKKRGPDPAETFVHLYDEEMKLASKYGFRDEDGTWHEARELGIDMLEHYADYYGGDGHIETIAPEQSFRQDLNTRDGKRYLVSPVGTFDAIIRNLETGKVGLFEHKTAASITTRHLPLDEQAGTYHALAGSWLQDQGILKKGEQIDFILYNFLRKAIRDTRPKNPRGHYLNKPSKAALAEAAEEHAGLSPAAAKKLKVGELREVLESKGKDPDQLGEVSKSQPPEYFERETVYRDEYDRQQLLYRIRAQAWEMSEAEKGKLPIYKHPTRDCSWDCAFYDVCELHETGADWEEMMKLTMVKWDPYAAPYDRNVPGGV